MYSSLIKPRTIYISLVPRVIIVSVKEEPGIHIVFAHVLNHTMVA